MEEGGGTTQTLGVIREDASLFDHILLVRQATLGYCGGVDGSELGGITHLAPTHLTTTTKSTLFRQNHNIIIDEGCSASERSY